MRRHGDAGQRQRSVWRGEDVRSAQGIDREELIVLHDSRAAGAGHRSSGISHFEIAKVQAHAPRLGPFDPALVLRAGHARDVIELVERVVDRA